MKQPENIYSRVVREAREIKAAQAAGCSNCGHKELHAQGRCYACFNYYVVHGMEAPDIVVMRRKAK